MKDRKEDVKKFHQSLFSAKAGRIDNIWPVSLQLTYITKQQALNSGFGWSIWSSQLWSRPLAFPNQTPPIVFICLSITKTLISSDMKE